MKIKKEELMKEDNTEEIEKEKIKKEEDVLVESSFRANLSRFAYPSSPPSARRRPPKRPAPVSDSTVASLTVTVAVAQPTPVTVRQDASEGNNDEPDSVDPGAVQAQAQAQALRRSPRNLKRKGETRPSLDTGVDRRSHGGTRRPPSKKKRRVNPRAQDVDLSPLPNLGALPEYLAEDLDVLFCGINPGRTSATVGHHYANGTNHFWPCLHLSGFTPRQLLATEDSTLPEMYNLGLTNLVERASVSEAQLLNREMADGVPALLARIARWRPRVICFNGKGMWLHVERSLQQQLIQSRGSDDNCAGPATGSRVAVPKREDEDLLKPIIPDIIGQERSVKTERVTARCSLQQPSLKKDTSNDGVATRSRVAALSKREDEEKEKECKPSVAQADQERSSRLRTKRERSVSGGSSVTANSSDLEAGRVLRPPASVQVGRGGAVSSPSSPITPRRAATATQSTFAYGIQPYRAVHDVVPKNAIVRETLFCVFPSSSGRVVSHQRNDKVVLFKKLREDLELIKAGTFDTSSMQLVHLVRQV